ncbi:MAG: fasciclin domain-containing protein, partial [Dysgonamonadaceae bacterium]|nr:fasciclin domain-containing protein [Dysgonamonadaceae bacterium]
METNKLNHILKLAFICLVLAGVFSCEEDNSGTLVLDKNKWSITTYLQDKPSYSILMQALEATKLDEVLNLYGTITLFAPTDEAFRKYFQRNGISGIAQMNENAIREMLYYHMYNTVYSSASFTSGSLPEPTRQGGFIKMDITQGIKNTILNNSTQVDTMDIVMTNGIIHVINDVLEPPVQSMYDWLKEHPEYSIMREAFEKTANDTILKNLVLEGDTVVSWKTVFLESNAVLAENNIRSFDDLARTYSDSYYTSKRYTESYDSLNIFVRYHCMDKKFFLSDVTNDYFVSKSQGNWLLFGTSPGLSINRHTELVFDPEKG